MSRRSQALLSSVALLALTGLARPAHAQEAPTPPQPAQPAEPVVSPAFPPSPLPPGEPAHDAPPVPQAPVAEPPIVQAVSAPPSPEPEKAAEPTADAPEVGKKGQAKGGEGHVVVPKARVAFRGEFARHEAADLETFDLSVPSARVGIEYRAPFKWLSAEVEADVAGRPAMKDAFGQVKTRHFFARAGQFKVPFSEIAATSVWNLPLADRGLIHNLLTDWLDVGGRRPGVLAGYRHRGDVRLGFYGGAFEGSVQTTISEGSRETDLLHERSLPERRQISETPLLPSLLGRVELSVADLQFGAFYEHRAGSPAPFEVNHYFTAGADAVGELSVGRGALRFFADVVAGESWYLAAGREPDAEPTFLSGRVIVAHRFGGLEEEALYVEPYASLGLFDPDLDVTNDILRETAIGLNAGLWKRARLTLEGHQVAAGRNFPLTTAGFFGGADPDRIALLLQAGVSY